MPVRPSDTNPSISTSVIREVLTIENEIDKHLLQHLIGGKTSYLVSASDKSVVTLLMVRYQQAGWLVKLAYSGNNLFRLEFEDPDQVEITRRINAVRPTPVTASNFSNNNPGFYHTGPTTKYNAQVAVTGSTNKT